MVFPCHMHVHNTMLSSQYKNTIVFYKPTPLLCEVTQLLILFSSKDDEYLHKSGDGSVYLINALTGNGSEFLKHQLFVRFFTHRSIWSISYPDQTTSVHTCTNSHYPLAQPVVWIWGGATYINKCSVFKSIISNIN